MRRSICLFLVLFACSKKPSAQAPATAAGSIETAEGRARLLALMQVPGELPVDRSIRDLQAMVQRQPEKTEAWLALGHAWIVKARDDARPSLYANAGACADLVLAGKPDNRSALELQGLVLMNDHRFEEARAKMREVVTRWPDAPVGWGTLSDALLELGRYDEATQAAQQMVDLKPNLPSYSRASYLQWLRADLKGAKESVRVAIDAGADGKDHEPRAWVIVQAAMMFWNEGDEGGALAGFEQGLLQLPDFPPALVGKALVLVGRGDGRSAVPLLEKAYKANPLIATGWLLGDARQLAGDTAGAQQVWSEIQKRGRLADPRTLSLFLSTKKLDTEEAVRLALQEHKVRDDLYTEDAMAWALYRAGRLDEALAAAVNANKLGTRDARLWFHEGAIRLAKGETARGRELIGKALKLNPHFDRSGEQEARALLDARLAEQKK
jgi:tetratricopeptide (TPR) repeat protein